MIYQGRLWVGAGSVNGVKRGVDTILRGQ